MNKPILWVIGGCNGAGKSTYSNYGTPQGVTPFDFDKEYKKNYDAHKFDSELRDRMSWNQTTELFDNKINEAISSHTDFCYETNFHASPMAQANKFRKEGYQINLVYFCLNSVSEAIRRVNSRFERKGHYVQEETVKERFHDGYKNLDQHYKEFDEVYLIDTNREDAKPRTILAITDGKIENVYLKVDFLEELLPNIYSLSI